MTGYYLIAAGVLLLAWVLRPRRRRHGRALAGGAERLATDTDVRAARPLTPLPAAGRPWVGEQGPERVTPPVYKRPPQVPHAAPDTPRNGTWLHPRVIEELGHATVDECVDSIVMRAVGR